MQVGRPRRWSAGHIVAAAVYAGALLLVLTSVGDSSYGEPTTAAVTEARRASILVRAGCAAAVCAGVATGTGGVARLLLAAPPALLLTADLAFHNSLLPLLGCAVWVLLLLVVPLLGTRGRS